ncbi:SseB family protein [Streptomyces chryseus]|nr:SseB family protein [Streptomyces chryseus]
MSDQDTGAGELPDAVREALLRGRWYFQRPERPGFMAIGQPESAVIPAFSSPGELARFAGACEWFSTTGEDLMTLLPEGHGLVVDLAGANPQLLPAEMLAPLRVEDAADE